MSKVSEYAWKDKKMRFIKNVIKEDLVHEFSQVSIDFSENGEEMFAVFRNESGSELLLHFGDRFTLSFDKWHGDYMFTNDEYERLLWDIRDIIMGSAFAVSVLVGENLFISYLTRGELESAEDFIEDDPLECAGLRNTGAIIECAYYDRSRNKKLVLEKE